MHTSAHKRRVRSDLASSAGLTIVILFFVVSGFISYGNIRTYREDAKLVTHTHEVLQNLEDVISIMKDAETGQRGYVLTGVDKYLIPYNAAIQQIEGSLNDLEQATRDNPVQQQHIPVIRAHVKAKLNELAQTIELRRTNGFQAALSVVLTDHGKNEMDIVRSQTDAMTQEEESLRAKRFAEMESAYSTAIISGFLTCILGVVLSALVAYLIRRSSQAQYKQQWLQTGQVGLSKAMFGEQRADQLSENIMKFLAEYFGAQAGAFFVKEGGGFQRLATYGVASGGVTIEKFMLGEGLLGQAAKDKKPFLIHDVPEGYLTIGSALGQDKPRHLLISPAINEGDVIAVLEMGFFHPVDQLSLELLERMSDSIGVAIQSANYRAHLQNLLEETQRQSEELQSQSEELRVNNEELEEQSRALRESQSRLEQQQAEMEQTNSQLEEQTQQLEIQRDDLSRAKSSIQLKAQELERASQYKSDFLANMSHELRTPLNSSLILAKLLSDNPGGNLTSEQVKFAKTIESSGNDLLSLINDILDLSKIEAGHMEVHAESVRLERMLKDLTHGFEPVAKQKGLKFVTHIAPNCPPMIETDRQRLEQVLKNLLSNAIKFTDKGEVSLNVRRVDDKRIEFSVTDSGIGIAKEQQDSIFEAFRQADGTISRKYGGTGLGLSISRQLARLLGGTISLKSEHGKGSTFAITLHETYDPANVAPAYALPEKTADAEPHFETPVPVKTVTPVVTRTSRVEDDREKLSGNGRIILVIEDDESFARILYDLAQELDFQCLIAGTAEEALILVKQYLPSAVVLDVGLPDNSGLSVLDRLKHDPRTRHIPVHVVSANDHTETALSLGAAGYLLKPVKRQELLDSLKQVETRFAQRMRRVLIVEDDLVQQESLRKLLGSHDVETVGVATVGECLARLKETTFDCMVLDLTLPDASGYTLLETLSQEDAYSFPPVIVYTGHDLSPKEEQKLRRYSKSIIIKGAKSPERLLDEVTLFLHQVVAELPAEQQRMLEKARSRDAVLEGRHIMVIEDDIRNVYALTSILEPRGAIVHIARNGLEALDMLKKSAGETMPPIDLLLMDVMMPEMDGLTATHEIRKNPKWKKLPIIMLTAKAMKDDQERCLAAGANDYMAKPLDVEKLLSLVRVWMPR